MARSIFLVLVFALAGCAEVPRRIDVASPCYANEASYECQVERYHNVNVN